MSNPPIQSIERSSPQVSAFPFNANPQLVDSVFHQLCNSEQSKCDMENPQLLKLKPLLGINMLFSHGHDGFLPARLEFLRTLTDINPELSSTMSARWQIDSKQIEAYNESFNQIEKIVADNTPITLSSTVNVAISDSAHIEGYILSQLASFASNMKKPEPDRLERIARFATLFPFGKADISWDNKIPTTESLGCMVSCLKDVVLWAKYPRTYQFMNDAAAQANGIEAEHRYNIEVLTDHVQLLLQKYGVFDQRLLNKKQVRLIAGVKPLSSLLLTTLTEEGIAKQLEKIMSNNVTPNSSIVEKFNILLTRSEVEGDKTLLPLIHEVRSKVLSKYDRYRARIQTRNPQVLDHVGENLKIMRNKILKHRSFAAVIAALSKRKLIPEFFMVRQFDYEFNDGEPHISFTDLSADQVASPGQIILSHLKDTPEGHLRYASLHSLSPIVEITSKGIKGVPLEIQVEPWSPLLQVMYVADSIIYHAAKNLEPTTYDQTMIKNIYRDGMAGVLKWSSQN